MDKTSNAFKGWKLPLMAVGLMVVPIGALIAGFSIYDAVRLWIMAQTSAVAVLYGTSFSLNLLFYRRVKERSVSHGIRLGRTIREAGVLMLLLLVLIDLPRRMGEHHISIEAPLLQVGLICLLLAWDLNDRRSFLSPQEAVDENRE